MTKDQIKLRNLIVSALFAAIIGILAQVTIPLPLVPITGQTLAIGLASTILGSRYGSLAVLLYLLIGAAGIPVYSGFSGGFSHLVGPTGGYLVGFLPAAFLIGWYLEKTSFTFINALISNILGAAITLIFGTIWLKIAADLTWFAAIAGGITPFIIVGIIKAAIAAWVGVMIRKRLISAKLLFTIKSDIKGSV